MNHKPLNTPDEPYARTKVSLLHLITQNVEQQIDRLPPEDELSKRLGVSRVLLRDVLGELEARGYIARKRGKGTVINTQICQAQPRIDEQISFMDLIQSKGVAPEVQLLSDGWVEAEEADVPADAEILLGGGALLCLERLFLGNGTPLIHSKVYFKGENLAYDYRKWSGYSALSLSEFLEIFCSSKPTVNLAELDLYQARAELAGKLRVAEGTSLFQMTDIRYDFDGHELVRGRATFCPCVLPLKLVRHSD